MELPLSHPRLAAVRLIVGYLLLSNLLMLPAFYRAIGVLPKPAITFGGLLVFITLQLVAMFAARARQRTALAALFISAVLWLGTAIYVLANMGWIKAAFITHADSPLWMLYRFIHTGSVLEALEIAGHVHGLPIWLGPIEVILAYGICLLLTIRKQRSAIA